MSLANLRLTRKRSPLCFHSGPTLPFTMLHFFKIPLLQLMLYTLLAIASLLFLSEHNCQTIHDFSRQSNWTPVTPRSQAQPASQLASASSDGAKEASSFAKTTTTGSPPNTVSKDIRKLLEDYVTYLSTLPDFQKETSNFALTQKSRLNREADQFSKFSTPQTFTVMSTPMAASSISDLKVTHSPLKSAADDSELQGSASTVVAPVVGSSAHRQGSNYYLEMPTESGLTLNLSDEELSTFIDNVLSHAVVEDFNSSTATAPVNEFEENSVLSGSLPVSSTPPSVTLENALIVTANTTNAHSNATEKTRTVCEESTEAVERNNTISDSNKPAAATTTELPFFRAEMFENSDEIVDTTNEDDINLLSKDETAADLKDSDEPFYTSDGEAVTEASNSADLSPDDDDSGSASRTNGNLNETSIGEDETNSNNYNRKLVPPIKDTELLRELKRTKDLLRVQIDKLQSLENSEQENVEESARLATTTESPETTTIGDTKQGLRNANDADLESFTTTTELPLVTGSAMLEERTLTTTVSADESMGAVGTTTALDCSPIDSTTEAPNEFNEAISTTVSSIIISNTSPPAVLSINENFALANYSRASLQEETIPNSTTKATKVSNGSVEDITATTAVVPLVKELSRKQLRTSVDDLRAATSKRESNVANWNTKPIVKRGGEDGKPENATKPINALDLTKKAEKRKTFSLTNVTNVIDDDDGNVRNDTDSETMIFTHVPKITIIHKIMKPSGSGAKSQQTDEEDYREALRKHKDLIKTAMSSISLVPAAFKRYKINNKNKVNIGEIYLLPNFAGSTASGRALRVLPHGSKVSFDRQYVHEFGRTANTASAARVNSVEQRKPIIIRQVRMNTLPKFAYTQLGNKFNAEASGGHPLISPPPVIDEELLRRQVLQENRAKLYVNYLNSIVAKHQSPENILKLYRPNFIHRKRFKKVRIPSGYRLKSKKGMIPLTTITTAANASPILISIAQQSNEGQENGTVRLPRQPLVSDISERTPQHLSQETGAPIQMRSSALSTGQLRKKETTMTSSRRGSTIDKSRFKVFCTYDAHRSLSAASANDRSRIFDIHQLEQNAAILEQCTHLVYAFASINMNGEVLPAAPTVTKNDGNVGGSSQNETLSTSALHRIKTLKERYPHLRVLVAVGGWSTPTQLFSLLVATSKLRDRLCQNVHKFVLNYDFDGAIISWFYPVYGSKSAFESSQRSPRSTSGQTLFQLDDKQNLVKFMRSLRSRFDSIPHKNLEIGLMSPPFEEQIDRGYDVAKLSNLVDHLILLTFDYYGSWDDKVHHFAPLYPPTKGLLSERDSKLNINYTLSYWLKEKQAPRDKTVLGLAFFGRSFTLESPSVAEPGAKAVGPGIAGPITNKPGLLAFNELCDLYLGHPAVRLNEDEHRITAHLQVFDQFVGFDDELSLYMKTKYAISNHLSGVFIWSINHDDYRNRCGWGRFPLLKAINKAVEHCKSSAVPCKV